MIQPSKFKMHLEMFWFSIGGVRVENVFHWILSVTMQLIVLMDQMKSP